MLVSKFTFFLLCTPFLQVTICGTRVMALVRDLVSAVQAGALHVLFFAWNVSQTFKELEAKMKHNDTQ